MEICGKRELDLLRKIGFVRTAGSPEELKAAQMIQAECEAIGVHAEIEPFEIEDAVVKTAKLEVLEPEYRAYEVTGYKCAGNTPPDGLEADFLYVENATDVNLAGAAGKIVLVNGMVHVPLYRKLLKAGVAGFISMEGELRDRPDETDLSTRKLRKTLRAFGSLPCVHMRVKDAFELAGSGAGRVRLTLENEVVHLTSHNVVAVLPGEKNPGEIVSFGAHYDSVPFSTGVYDNGAGSVINLEILRYFKENPPKRTVKFMWYGSEEIGLEGSWAYVRAHKDELLNHRLMINVDVGGPVLGVDKVIVTAEDRLMTFADYFMKIGGYSAEVRQDIYSTDCIPFADSGVPAINFSRDGAPGAAYIHNRYDRMDFLSADALKKTTEHVLDFGKTVINAAVFPVEKKIPDNIREKVENYLYKKELAEIEG